MRRFLTLLCLILLAIVGAWPRGGAHASTASPVALSGNVLPVLARSTRLGPADPNARLAIAVNLRLPNPSSLESLLNSLEDPSSPQFRRFLTRDQFVAAYAPGPATVTAVTDFLQHQGLAVTYTFPNRLRIDASGTIGAVERAFRLTIDRYRAPSGREFIANSTAPVVPGNLAGDVSGIDGLQTFSVWHGHAQRATVGHGGTGPNGGLAPSDVRGAYNFGPLYTAHGTGAGHSIAVYELAAYAASNISTYDSHFGLTPGPLSNTPVDGGTSSTDGQDEAELDIEIVQALAPSAPIHVYTGANSGSAPDDVYSKIVSANVDKVVTTSWGLCEPQQGNQELQYEHTIFQEAAAQGQSIVAASGDDGAYDCGDFNLAVDSPADDPDVIGAGGTTLTVSNGAFTGESAWTGSGGGLSTYFSRPSWQTGPGVINSSSNGKRQVSDVACVADPSTGWAIFTQGSWAVYGGTSAAAPAWAAALDDVNSYAAYTGHATVGYANPRLYGLMASNQPYPPFHDVTSGFNDVYYAGTGWDYPTGWGSPNAWNLARDLGTNVSPPPTVVPTTAPTTAATAKATTAPTTAATAKPTTAPTHAPTATATKPQPTATKVPPTATSTPPPTNLISNGGFEGGTSGWSLAGAPLPSASTRQAHAGSYSLLLGQPTVTLSEPVTNRASQTITLPTSATSITLSFWYTSTCYSATGFRVTATIGTSTLTVLSTCSTTGGWQHVTYSLSAYAGRQVTLNFTYTVANSYSAGQAFVDDVLVTKV